MPVKFKVGFTIDAQTLFAMMSKFLPVDDVTVEELIERPPPVQPTLPHDWSPGWNKQIAKSKPKLKKKYTRTKPAVPMRLDAGINRILMEMMADGKPHRAMDLRPLLKKGGFSENSAGSRLQALRVAGVVEQMGDGMWRLKSLPPTVTTGAGRE
jgi:hypothetical protein